MLCDSVGRIDNKDLAEWSNGGWVRTTTTTVNANENTSYSTTPSDSSTSKIHMLILCINNNRNYERAFHGVHTEPKQFVLTCPHTPNHLSISLGRTFAAATLYEQVNVCSCLCSSSCFHHVPCGMKKNVDTFKFKC